MSGFANSIIGGASKLIRAAIQSPNFVTGATGWTINKDGTAEFNSLTVRGTIILQPTPNTGLYANSIRWNDGFANPGAIWEDSTNNDVLNIYPPGGAGVRRMIITLTPGNALPSDSQLQLKGDTAQPVHAFINQGTNGIVIQHDNPVGASSITDIGGLIGLWSSISRGFFTLAPQLFFKFGSGDQGVYYEEEWSAPGTQAVGTAALSTLVGWVPYNSQNDYGGTRMIPAAGTWTCPANGIYTITLYVEWTAAISVRSLILIGDTTLGRNLQQMDQPSTARGNGISTTCFIAAGDVLVFQVLQSSGANRTVGTPTHLSIYRNL